MLNLKFHFKSQIGFFKVILPPNTTVSEYRLFFASPKNGGFGRDGPVVNIKWEYIFDSNKCSLSFVVVSLGTVCLINSELKVIFLLNHSKFCRAICGCSLSASLEKDDQTWYYSENTDKQWDQTTT